MMAPGSRHVGRLQPCRPSSDHHNAARLNCRLHPDFGFPAGDRIDQAVSPQSLSKIPKASLMTRWAKQDSLLVTRFRLPHPVRIGQKCSADGHGIAAVARGEGAPNPRGLATRDGRGETGDSQILLAASGSGELPERRLRRLVRWRIGSATRQA